MTMIESVSGPLAGEDLGLTLVHEHVLARAEAVAYQWPHLYDEDALHAAALEAVRAAMDAGVETICDPAAMLLGRDIHAIRRVAEDTGAQLIACTGIYTYDHLPFYWSNRSEDAMADAFVHDIEQGIQGTDTKAAFLKCAADEPGVTPNVEKVHRACARAHLRTGVPIMAHTRPASQTGIRQIEVFEEEGVDLARVQLAHTGDTDELDYIERVLEKGVFIGMDRYGLEMFLPMDRRNATVLSLLERGYADRMLISQDFCASIDWFPSDAAEGLVAAGLVDEGWSMTLVFEKVFPALRDGGMNDEQLATMLEENPRRWLAG
jgi:phosphotriesterase-related protein